ncbi:YopX family protein [Peribacillus sp. R9-11]|uniref:YopX family protein n=1 Tax=Peribacillus sp. R9-11 TaxID=3073271 RepID=UPI002868EC3C|nr:YopX family protein [Peribacillus sp. R9-11]WMX57426.1 YopX family protein [Peribacillus sp. R9-11]
MKEPIYQAWLGNCMVQVTTLNMIKNARDGLYTNDSKGFFLDGPNKGSHTSFDLNKAKLRECTGYDGIYEGDVLYGEEIGEYGSILSSWKGLVYRDEEKCGFYVKDDLDIYRLDDYDYSKIIGNIYENPELLES